MSVIIGVDLGKTSCRARIRVGDRSTDEVTGPGAIGLAEPEGVADATTAVVTVVARALRLLGEDHASEGSVRVPRVETVVIGAAGAEAAAQSATRLANAVLDAVGAVHVAVTSDAVIAHAGAFSGHAGSVVSIGTGAVAVAVDERGRLHRSDGWGPWLGDDGSGAWIGREGLRAVLLAAEGRGGPTALTELAERRFGARRQLPEAVSAGNQVARTLASFAPDVLSAAATGDPAAEDVVGRAGRALAETVMTTARAAGVSLVTAVGGLTDASLLTDAWRAALPSGVTVRRADGTAIDGALLLAGRTDLPHESQVLRVNSAAHLGRHRATSVDVTPRSAGTGHEHVDVDGLATERVRPDLFDLDMREPEELVALLLEAEATVPDVMRSARPSLAAAVRLVEAAFEAGGRLIYVGAGTPGRLAAVDAAECPPTFGTSPDQVVALLAGGNRAAVAAVEGAEDDEVAGRSDLDGLEPGRHDVVVGITASGRTPYVLAALDHARARGAATVAIVNNPGSPAKSHADVLVELPTGGEVLAGSTRLKAGTSQKVALNVLSTSAMIRSGKTYGAWMVDVMASNEKLRRRARRILREATGVDDLTALQALDDCGWNTKTAMVSVLTGLDPDASRRRLEEAGGHVRQAVSPAALASPAAQSEP